MAEKYIAAYIADERRRCRELAKKLARGTDAGLLLFCIDQPYDPSEIENARQRYAEAGGDNIEELF